jgi:uncharacterized protein (TIGR00369 family)
MSPRSDPNPLLSQLQTALADSPYYRSTGITVADAEPGNVTAAIELDQRHLNLQGLAHGGVIATIGDVAMGLAVRTMVGPSRPHLTIEIGVHYLRPAPPGVLRSNGRAVRVGAQIAYAEADVSDAEGRLVARATGSYFVGSRARSADPEESHPVDMETRQR